MMTVGYVFTGVCPTFGGGGGPIEWGDTPSGPDGGTSSFLMRGTPILSDRGGWYPHPFPMGEMNDIRNA